MTRWLRHLEPRSLAAVAVLSIVNGALPAAGVLLVRRALDGVVGDRTLVGPALVGLVGLALVAPLTAVGRAALSRRMAWGLVHDLRLAAHERLHALQGPGSAGDRVAALADEADELQYVVSAFVTALRAPLTIALLLGSAVWTAPAMAGRLLLAAPIVAVVGWAGSRWVHTLAGEWRTARAALFGELTDQHNGLATTLDHGATAAQVERARRVSEREVEARVRLDWGRTVPSAVLQSLVILVVVGLLWAGLADLDAGRATPGGLVAFALAVVLLRDPIVRGGEILTLLARASAALARLEATIATPIPERRAPTGRFVVRDLRIPGRLEVDDLTIAPGEKIALVGPSGSGKSTLLAVLSGQLGDAEREPTVLCRQEPWIFDRTLRENLELAGPVQDAGEALATVGLDGLAGRLDAPVGDQGTRLSGGERQRLALARAMLVEGRALLLDEATSEVSADQARELAGRLAEVAPTVVFATHEPWFPRLADRVVWLAEGRVRAVGRHAELLEDPAYAALWGDA
ncbi:MAG: ABC transporter ATP-binding protein [Alphaproteobacteria bacterium]|nr:ABC transporter ATP-binding protein [Alphaproteobacteria bacterium]